MHEKNDWVYCILDCGRHAAYAFFYKQAGRSGHMCAVAAYRVQFLLLRINGKSLWPVETERVEMKMIGEATVKKTAGQDWAGRKTAERGMTEKEGTGNITEKKAIKEKTIEDHVIKEKMAEGNLIKEKKTEFDVIKEKMTEGSAIKEGEIKERLITEGAAKEKAAEKEIKEIGRNVTGQKITEEKGAKEKNTGEAAVRETVGKREIAEKEMSERKAAVSMKTYSKSGRRCEMTGKNRIQKELAEHGRDKIKQEISGKENHSEKEEIAEREEMRNTEAKGIDAADGQIRKNKAESYETDKREVTDNGTETQETKIKETKIRETKIRETKIKETKIRETKIEEMKTKETEAGIPAYQLRKEGCGLRFRKAGMDKPDIEGEEKELRCAVLKEEDCPDAKLQEERLRMETQQKELEKMRKQLERDKQQFAEYVKAKESSIDMDRKRLEQENRFFDQKMKILQGGFEQLEEDRRKFQKEKDKFDAGKEIYVETQDAFKRYEMTEMLFRGVNSFLALKKRYKDLIKMFHPDNVAGDHEMVQLINREYEELKKAYEVGMQA